MTEPIRVLHVMNDLRMGGGQQLVLNIMRSVDPVRVRPSICYVQPAQEMEDTFREAGFRPVSLGHERRLHTVRTTLRLMRLIRRDRIQVLHAHSSIDKHFAQLAGILSRVPVVNHLHMPYDYRAESSPRARVRALVRRLGAWLAVKHFIAVSKTNWDAHAPFVPGNRHRISLVPNGIPTARFARRFGPAELRRLRREIGVDGASPILINIGRLDRQKRQDTLIEMMAANRDRWPEARLLIVGEGAERSALEAHIRATDMGGRVHMLGTRSDVDALLALSDVFVFPSRAEGNPLALIEAMAAGKPIVVSELPVHAELIEDGVTGYLVDPNPTALADAVDRLLGDPRRARAMGVAAQRFAQEHCDLEVCARQITDVYERVVAMNGRPNGAR